MNNQVVLFTAILWLCSSCLTSYAFAPSSLDHHRPGLRPIPKPSALALTAVKSNRHANHSENISNTPIYYGIDESSNNHNTDSVIQTRRKWTCNMFKSMMAASTIAFINSSTVESAHAAEAKGPTIWKTGRAPEIPGQKPKDKGDVKGTKKDPSFLRSVADCKNQCENSYGPDGRGKTTAECLSECQDICCTTYEQCTFAIVPR